MAKVETDSAVQEHIAYVFVNLAEYQKQLEKAAKPKAEKKAKAGKKEG